MKAVTLSSDTSSAAHAHARPAFAEILERLGLDEGAQREMLELEEQFGGVSMFGAHVLVLEFEEQYRKTGRRVDGAKAWLAADLLSARIDKAYPKPTGFGRTVLGRA